MNFQQGTLIQGVSYLWAEVQTLQEHQIRPDQKGVNCKEVVVSPLSSFHAMVR